MLEGDTPLDILDILDILDTLDTLDTLSEHLRLSGTFFTCNAQNCNLTSARPKKGLIVTLSVSAL